MEIRTTNPELEELISILAANNLVKPLSTFAFKCRRIVETDPYGDIPLISIEQGTQPYPDSSTFEEELVPDISTNHIVRVVGVQKCQDPAAAAFLSKESANNPIAKLAALQTAYWVRQFIILYGMKKGKTLEEITEMVRRACTLQVKCLRTEIRRNRATKFLPKELRKHRDTSTSISK